jgi:hypothetical protein
MKEMAGLLDMIFSLVACTLKLGLQLDKIWFVIDKTEFASCRR